MISTKEQALEMVRKHGSKRAAAKAAGMAYSTFCDRLMGKLPKAEGSGTLRIETQKPCGRTLSDFRSEYDKSFIVPTKIKAALRTLGSGWDYEAAFAKLAGVSLSDLSSYRDQFADHVVSLNREGRRAWAGTPATAKAMKDML